MIESIQLRNFKCFSNETITLSNLNLLTGLNGMGKSSVIQSLLLLRQNYETGLLNNRQRLALNGDYVNIGTFYDLLYRYFDNKLTGIEIVTSDNKMSWLWSADDNNSDSLTAVSASQHLLSEYETFGLFNNNFHYLNAERIGPRPYYETSSTKVIHQNQLGVRGEFAANYFTTFGERPIPIPELRYISENLDDLGTEQGLSLYEQVNAWLGVIRPGAQARSKDQPDSGTTTLSFEFIISKDNPGPYRSQNVGFGLTYVFPLLVAILSSEPGTLLLIENPEAHIHPKGQAELGILLAKAAAHGIQLIVETHSDHILNGIRYAVKEELINKELVNIMFFTGSVEDDKFLHYIDYIKTLERGKLSHRPKDFFDVWDEMLTKLL